ncbi:MAG: hypothetical protein E4H01_01370 [Lysobacterales bacterium]|nr:MAG: hypothetical protein E4H01_01370 [Xanthomonadales bacterium]
MRAWEFLGEHRSPPSMPITLRALHKLRLDAKRREASEQERQAIMQVMYADPSAEQEQLELERLRLELDQLRAETEATKSETEAKSAIALTKNAKSGLAAMERNQDHITKLAKNGLGRKMKA